MSGVCFQITDEYRMSNENRFRYGADMIDDLPSASGGLMDIGHRTMDIGHRTRIEIDTMPMG